ncbi:hypothetical protein GCM10023231_40780 [Olivibacter ginsenosidimutans]|uniref:Peptidase M28 domain-containing protein n=2 Tax=Olivibacter ginsenosidimutans TaxID=1176537 RepID=A0ABP9CD76_9SPHI
MNLKLNRLWTLILPILWLFDVQSVFAQSQNEDQQYGTYVIKHLASKAFKGRGYGLGGDKKAADFIAAEFQKAGVKPLTAEGYFQKFTLGANIFPEKVDVKLNGKALRPGKDYLIWAGSPSLKGDFEVVHVNRIDLYESKHVDSIGALAAHKFLLIDNQKPATETAEQTAIVKESLLRLRNDETFNMSGVLVASNEKLTHTAQTKQTARVVLLVNKDDLVLSDIYKVSVNIESKWIPNYETQNVVAKIPGTQMPDSMIFITAHYDHLGTMGKKAIFYGANDNASGTAFMLDVAKYYAQHPPKYTLVFVGFAGEESGLLGSIAFVQHPPVTLSKIKFLLNFDMVGTGEEGITAVNATVFPKAFAKLQALNQEHHYLPQVKSRGESCNSDHCPFYQQGVPSFFIYTMGGIAAYHDILDRPETLPLTKFAQLKQLICAFVDSL